MKDVQCFVARSSLPVPVESAFAYHARPGALQRLIPPWESIEIADSDNSIAVGSQVTLRTRVLGIPFQAIAEHTQCDAPHLFADTLLSGPFKSWNHRHEFAATSDSVSQLTDSITYQLPGGSLGKVFAAPFVRLKLQAMFAYRHRITRDDLQLSVDYPSEPLTIAVSGSTGLLGSQLCSLLSQLGHRVWRIVRDRDDDAESLAIWKDEHDAAKLSQVDAVVHLAGEPIASARWTDATKQRIRESRVDRTHQLCERLSRLDRKPQVLVCASATGLYGDRGDEILNEQSSIGNDFLASVAQEWEQACAPAMQAGIRVVYARFGMILSPRGGALKKMLLPAKLFGGSLGSGEQWWGWIAIDDALGGIYHAITRDSAAGPMNFVSPEPIRNRDFAETLGQVIGRPAIVPAPAFALRLALGEMADGLLLASCRAVPKALTDTGYRFRFQQLDTALRHLLGYERLGSVTCSPVDRTDSERSGR